MGKRRYREGAWVAIPMGQDGYALGRIARVCRGGVLLMYFFGRKVGQIPSPSEIPDWDPSQAVLIGKVGDLHILQGRWAVIPAESAMDRHLWKVPQFQRTAALTGRTYRVTYDESNLLTPIAEEVCDPHLVAELPADGLMGAGFVEKRLARLVR